MSDTTATTFRVGDRVLYDGRPATIWQPNGRDLERSHVVKSGGHVIRFDDDLDDGRGWSGEYGQGPRMWFALSSDLTPLDEPAKAPKTDAAPSTDIDATSALTAQVAALTSQIQAMQDDVAIIGEHLKRTAERHEWCGEYEEHLSRLVDDLSEHSAKTLHDAAKRVQTYRVSRTLTYTVEACDRAQAERVACDRYGFDFDWQIEEV